MMTSPTTDHCILALTDKTLSAWRDEMLGQGEMRRISAHVPTCPACQQRSGDFERIRHALLGQRIPEMQARVWHGLRNSIDTDVERRRRRWTHTTTSKGLATLAAVVLIALFATLLYAHNGRPSLPGSGTPTGNPIATNTLTATAASTATATIPSPSNWTRVDAVGNQGFPAIAFAPSQPARGYAFNGGGGGRPTYVASIVVTSDGGKTWQVTGSPGVSGTNCIVSVDPVDPQDVVVVNHQTQNGIDIARSRDGGATWTRPNFGTLAFDALGWAGSSLYVATQVTENPVSSQVNLYVSRNGQPPVRLDTNGVVSGITLGSPRFITGLGSTVFLQWGQIQPPVGETTIVSHDNGQTWTPVTFHDGSERVHLIHATPTVAGDALVMVGIYDSANNQVVVSRDEGATWQKLPAASSGVQYFSYLWVAPDGMVFAVSNAVYQQVNPDRTIYSATAGDAQWRVASVLPVDAIPLTAAWDSNGHPTEFWASMGYLIVDHL